MTSRPVPRRSWRVFGRLAPQGDAQADGAPRTPRAVVRDQARAPEGGSGLRASPAHSGRRSRASCGALLPWPLEPPEDRAISQDDPDNGPAFAFKRQIFVGRGRGRCPFASETATMVIRAMSAAGAAKNMGGGP